MTKLTKEQRRERAKFSYTTLGELGVDDSEASGPPLIDPDDLPDGEEEEEEGEEEEGEEEEGEEPTIIFDRNIHIHTHTGDRVRTHRLRITIDAESFKESEHPRNKIGEFAAKGSGGAPGTPGSGFIPASLPTDLLAGYGFSYAGTTGPASVPTQKFKSASGTKVAITLKADGSITWEASSPGHLTKTGEGITSLKLLQSGAPPGPNPPWKSMGTVPAYLEIGAVPGKEATPAPSAQKPHQVIYEKLKGAAPKPSGVQSAALGAYTGSGHSTINDCLRYDDTCSDGRVPALEAYLDGASLKESITVYRGVGGEYAKILASIATVGTKFVDKGFLSTSTRSDLGFGNLNLKITAPAGTKAAAISHFGSHSNEYEVLFQRGSALVVKSYDKVTKTLHVDILQEGTHQAAVPVGVAVGEGPGALGTPSGAPSQAATPAPSGAAPKVQKIKKVKPDDPYPAMSFEALMTLAGEKGYVEKKPELQPKVRRMRVVIFLRNLDKKAKANG